MADLLYYGGNIHSGRWAILTDGSTVRYGLTHCRVYGADGALAFDGRIEGAPGVPPWPYRAPDHGVHIGGPLADVLTAALRRDDYRAGLWRELVGLTNVRRSPVADYRDEGYDRTLWPSRQRQGYTIEVDRIDADGAAPLWLITEAVVDIAGDADVTITPYLCETEAEARERAQALQTAYLS